MPSANTTVKARKYITGKSPLPTAATKASMHTQPTQGSPRVCCEWGEAVEGRGGCAYHALGPKSYKTGFYLGLSRVCKLVVTSLETSGVGLVGFIKPCLQTRCDEFGNVRSRPSLQTRLCWKRVCKRGLVQRLVCKQVILWTSLQTRGRVCKLVGFANSC